MRLGTEATRDLGRPDIARHAQDRGGIEQTVSACVADRLAGYAKRALLAVDEIVDAEDAALDGARVSA